MPVIDFVEQIMTTITLHQDTMEELERVAENKGTALDELAELAIRQFLLEEKRESIRLKK